ncbi:alpha/beta fold hydrolase [Aeoliella mucimassa]|uniref:Pimeloyl-[acyl-carrier protein] methyl ester esterase n=1 Tax=Aeoliella mucimassa TaxID=2527972 RepID=A0A518AP40_9BACT|nr:alpha/beta hydrolase [Aeoliella mucimassa]QDU56487.1 Pimeloyl-[acyl-carrier protein] methyl ester esterase [Aeoliella mucimassa]
MSNPNIVLISGWGQTSEPLAELANELSVVAEVQTTSVYQLAESWQTSSRPLDDRLPPTAVSLYAEQLHEQYLKAEPVMLVGWSMGAMVALEAANTYADHVERLVLVGGCASFCQRKDEVGLYEAGVTEDSVAEMIAGLNDAHKRTCELFLRNVYRRAIDKQQLATKVGAMLQLDVARLQHGLRYLQQADLRSQLSGIPQPMLLLHGSADRVVDSRAAGYLQEHLSQVKLELYPDGTHGLCEQYPAAVAEQIRGFLEDGEQPLH